MPDILLIRQISKDFNISLDELFDGEYKKTIIKKGVHINSSQHLLLLNQSVRVSYQSGASEQNRTAVSTLARSHTNLCTTPA